MTHCKLAKVVCLFVVCLFVCFCIIQCLRPLYSVNGWHITTVEGLGR